MAEQEQQSILAEIHWEGDSREVIRAFPKDVKGDLGLELDRLQRGKKPLKSRPMKSIGKGVFELKEQDRKTWYRVIYLAKIENKIYVLHCFEKDSAKTSRNDLKIAEHRLKQVSARILEEKKSEKRKK